MGGGTRAGWQDVGCRGVDVGTWADPCMLEMLAGVYESELVVVAVVAVTSIVAAVMMAMAIFSPVNAY